MSIETFIPPAHHKPWGYLEGARPVEITQRSFNEPFRTEFEDGSIDASACLRCPDTPCIQYSIDEADAFLRIDITPLTDRAVCSFDALALDEVTCTPLVDRDRCAACGLCVARCPVGAIRWSTTGAVEVQSDLGPSHRPTSSLEDHLEAREMGQRVRLPYVPPNGEWPVLRERFDAKVANLGSSNLRLLVRNLLRGLGVIAHAAVRGDTSGNGGLNWPHCGGLNWPHLRPIGHQRFELYRARARGGGRNGVESGAV